MCVICVTGNSAPPPSLAPPPRRAGAASPTTKMRNKCQVVGEQSDRKRPARLKTCLRLQQRTKNPQKNSLSIHIRSGSFGFWQLEADLIAVNDVMIDSDGPVNNRQDLFYFKSSLIVCCLKGSVR